MLGDRPLVYDAAAASAVVGPDVGELQTLLVRLSYQVTVDAVYGPTTCEEVRRFQQDRGLLVDGVFGRASFQELSRVLGQGSGPKTPFFLRDIWP